MDVGAVSLDVAGAGLLLFPYNSRTMPPALSARVASPDMAETTAQTLTSNPVAPDRYIRGSAAHHADYGPQLKAQARQRSPASQAGADSDTGAGDPRLDGGRSEGQAALSRARVEYLRRQDQGVRRHEMAHVAAGAHGVSYRLIMGPDGRSYAVGGQAMVATTNLSFTPEEALAKARQTKRAALAPMDPSSQDMRVAAQADREIQQALLEIQARNAPTPALMARSDGSLLSLISSLRSFAYMDSRHQQKLMGGAPPGNRP